MKIYKFRHVSAFTDPRKACPQLFAREIEHALNSGAKLPMNQCTG